MKNLLLVALLLCVSACATSTGSMPGAMVAPLTKETLIEEKSALYGSVSIGTVAGGEETNPLTGSKVSNEAFREALRRSLAAHAMLADDQGGLILDAELVNLDQPSFGSTFTVSSTVIYVVRDVKAGRELLRETVTESFTVTRDESFVATERLRLANEGSIRASISTLIKLLVDLQSALSLNFDSKS